MINITTMQKENPVDQENQDPETVDHGKNIKNPSLPSINMFSQQDTPKDEEQQSEISAQDLIRFNSPKGEKEEKKPVIKRERRAKADRVDLASKLVSLNINTDKIKAVSFWNSPDQTPASV